MYLAPWQIFASGCLAGAFFTLVVLIAIFARLIIYSGLRIEKEDEEEKRRNGEL